MYLRNRMTEQQIMAITSFATFSHIQHTVNLANYSMPGFADQLINTYSCTCHAASKYRKQLVQDS